MTLNDHRTELDLTTPAGSRVLSASQTVEVGVTWISGLDSRRVSSSRHFDAPDSHDTGDTGHAGAANFWEKLGRTSQTLVNTGIYTFLNGDGRSLLNLFTRVIEDFTTPITRVTRAEIGSANWQIGRFSPDLTLCRFRAPIIYRNTSSTHARNSNPNGCWSADVRSFSTSCTD